MSIKCTCDEDGLKGNKEGEGERRWSLKEGKGQHLG